MKQEEFPTIETLIDQLKHKKKLFTDRECAHLVRAKPQSISQWKLKKHQIGLEQSILLGELIEMDPLMIMIYGQYHFKDEPQNQEKWKELASRVQSMKTAKKKIKHKVNKLLRRILKI